MGAKSDQEPNLSMNPRIERDRQLIVDARAKGKGAMAGTFVRLSGPGWLQSAITLGGGSLSSSMYLGVLGGFCFLWLQPLAMMAGIVMLSAIAYVTLSTGERPLRAINKHVNPVLGWGWLFASMAANLVWSMPQYSLATASFQQNLFPQIFGVEVMPDPYGKLVVGGIILVITLSAGMLYSIGGWGVKAFEIVVKCLVALTVACFISTVVKLTWNGVLDWGAIGSGFIPNLDLLSEPVEAFKVHIANVPEQFQSFWSGLIVGQQRDVMISAAATAVGINMTFLFPYSMLRKGWDKDFRGLAIFDLSTGLFFPFLFATSCVVIAAASQFNATPAQGLIPLTEDQTLNEMGQVVGQDGKVIQPAANLAGPYKQLLRDRIMDEKPDVVFASLNAQQKALVVKRVNANAQAAAAKLAASNDALQKGQAPPPVVLPELDGTTVEFFYTEAGLSMLSDSGNKLFLDALIPEMPETDRRMAAMLVRRDAFNLAGALAPLVGDKFSQYVFGLGVLGMAMGAATMLMLINGLCFCELLNKPAKGWPQRVGMMMVGVGILGPLFWTDAKMWLAIPTSVFACVLLPLAYFSFFLLMNQKSLLGEHIPKGGKRVAWNVAMAISAGLAAFASAYILWSKAHWYGVAGVIIFTLLVIVVHFTRKRPGSAAA